MVHEAFRTVSEVCIKLEAITSIHRHLRKNPIKGLGSLGSAEYNCAAMKTAMDKTGPRLNDQ